METTMLIQMSPETLSEMIEEAVKRAFAKRKDDEAKKVKPEDRLYALEEVTDRLNMTAGSIRKKILTGDIKGVKVGQKWMVKLSAIDEYLKACEEKMPMTDKEIESRAATHCALNKVGYVRMK